MMALQPETGKESSCDIALLSSPPLVLVKTASAGQPLFVL